MFEQAASVITDHVSKRAAMEQVYEKTQLMLDELVSEEMASRSRFNERTEDYLRKFNQINEKVEQRLTSVDHFAQNVSQVMEELEGRLPAATQQLAEVSRINAATAESLNKTIEQLQQFSATLSQRVMDAAGEQQQLESSINKFLTTFEDRIRREKPQQRWMVPVAILAGAVIIALVLKFG